MIIKHQSGPGIDEQDGNRKNEPGLSLASLKCTVVFILTKTSRSTLQSSQALLCKGLSFLFIPWRHSTIISSSRVCIEKKREVLMVHRKKNTANKKPNHQEIFFISLLFFNF